VNESTSRGTPTRTTNSNGENSMPEDASNFASFDYDADSNITREISMAQPQQPQHHRTQQSHRMLGKKPRLVFTEVQRRTLQAIFKETKRPSRELQQQIAEQLQLDPTTVANYFMNARRRGHGINGGNGTGENGQIGLSEDYGPLRLISCIFHRSQWMPKQHRDGDGWGKSIRLFLLFLIFFGTIFHGKHTKWNGRQIGHQIG
jgi:hypothetical protein